jgi:hypothetical protein
MRPVAVILLACLPLFAFAAADKNAGPSSVEVVRLWPGYRTDESFDRISEYFTDKENTGAQLLLRTQPKERAGYYFLLRVKNAAPLAGARIELDLITAAAPRPKTHTFTPASLPAGKPVLNLGVTGADWPGGPDAHPVAWRLRLLAVDGRELLSEQSFLWGRPPASRQ